MSDERSERRERLDNVIADYLRAVDSGQSPDPEALFQQHPDLADEIAEFFQGQAELQQLAADSDEEADPTLMTDANPALEKTYVPDTEPTTKGRPARECVGYFGDYELLAEIARGGMGVVYKARQVNLDRVVALKMILAGHLASEEDVRRFYQEAEAAANLDHAGIVPIYEVGQHEGQHFFSMAFIEGESLAQRLSRSVLPAREAAELVREIAEAVQYAHEKGVVHRDLKPANILLNREGEPRITDFGLAKKIEDDSGLTATGQVLGTPSFMAPEQAAGRTDQVAEPADVYALGAVLYDALTGRPPFQAGNPLDTLMQVLEKDPISPRELNPSTPKDLETICLKCLEKDRSRRYHSARELGEELDRFLTGRPIQARPVSTVTRTWRWCRRNPAAAIALVAISALFLTATAGAFWVNAARKEAVRHEAIAVEERKEVERQKGFVQDQRDEANRQRDLAKNRQHEADRQRKLALERLEHSQRLIYASQILQAKREWEGGDYGAARETLNLTQPDLRGWEYGYLLELFNRNQITLTGHTGTILSVAVSPDGKRIASTGGGTLKIWDVQTGKQLHSFKSGESPVAFSSDGRRVISGRMVWNLETGESKRWAAEIKLPPTNYPQSYGDAWNQDRTLIAKAKNPWAAQGPEVCMVREAQSGEILHTLTGHRNRIIGMAFSPDATLLVCGDEGGVIKIWSLETGKEVRSIQAHEKYVQRIVFRADGKNFASYGPWDRTVKVFETESGNEIYQLSTDENLTTRMAFRPHTKQLAMAWDNVLKLWDLETGKEIVSLVGHDEHITDLAFTPDGKKIVTGSYDHTVKIWDADRDQTPRKLQGKIGRSDTISFTPDGNRVILGGGDYTDFGETGDVSIWDVHTGKRLQFHESYGRLVAVSPDGDRVASAGFSGKMRIWNARTGETLFDDRNAHKGIHALAFSPDGKRLVTGGDGTLKLWDAENRQHLQDLKGLSERVYCVAFSPKGHTFVTAGGHHHLINPELILWDAHTGQRKRTFEGHTYSVTYAAFHPDGKTLATASRDKLIKIWDVETGKELATLKGHTHWVTKVIYSPDGSRLFSTGIDGTTRVWDTRSGSELLTLNEVRYALALSPNGRTLVGIGPNDFLNVLEVPNLK